MNLSKTRKEGIRTRVIRIQNPQAGIPGGERWEEERELPQQTSPTFNTALYFDEVHKEIFLFLKLRLCLKSTSADRFFFSQSTFIRLPIPLGKKVRFYHFSTLKTLGNLFHCREERGKISIMIFYLGSSTVSHQQFSSINTIIFEFG